jgi:excisionase family DNA binding protein
MTVLATVRCYSVAELAELWGVGQQYVYDEINAGRLATIQFGRGDRNKLRVNEADAVLWVDRHRMPAHST